MSEAISDHFVGGGDIDDINLKNEPRLFDETDECGTTVLCTCSTDFQCAFAKTDGKDTADDEEDTTIRGGDNGVNAAAAAKLVVGRPKIMMYKLAISPSDSTNNAIG